MTTLQSKGLLKTVTLILTFLHLSFCAFSQEKDSTKRILNFRGTASITNNGFSFIPSFSLGKPATIVTLSAGGKRFSFEPEFRYSLEGKPWSFIFIWRYKLIKADKFQFTVGTHLPALNFRTISVVKDSIAQDIIQSQRFFPVLELSPNFMISKSVSVGMFYLYGRGAKEVAAKNTHFLSLRCNFSNIPIVKQWYFRFSPQVFYLAQDAKDGFYVASGLTLARRNFPLSISSLMNKPIQTDIAGKKIDWNISLVYSFDKKFVRQ